MTRQAFRMTPLAILGMGLLGALPALAASSGTVAFLMPDQASTRYEQHDFPGFKAEMSKLCPDCKVLYQNANRFHRRGFPGAHGAEPGHQGDCL